MRPRPRRDHVVAGALLTLCLALGSPAPLARAAEGDVWRLAVGGAPVTARLDRRDGVLVVDLAAVGPRVGLAVRRDGDAIAVSAGGPRAWTATAGDSFFSGPLSQVFLERPLAIDGDEVLVPLEAVATLSGHFAALDPARRRADLARPERATRFEIPKAPEEIARMEATRTDGGDGRPESREGDQRLNAPSAHGSMRLNATASYIPGADGALALAGNGLVSGVQTHFALSTTLGADGVDLLTGRLVLDDPELGWSFGIGDLQSHIWGGARGVSASYRIVDGWQPTLSVYVPWERSALEAPVVSWTERLQLNRALTLDAELASDASGFARLGLQGDTWMLGARFTRRALRRLGTRHEAGLYGTVRASRDVSMSARLAWIDPDRADGSIRANLGVTFPVVGRMIRAALRHDSLMTSQSWSHIEDLALQLRAGPVSGRLGYRLRLNPSHELDEGFMARHSVSAGASVRFGALLSARVDARAEIRSDDTLAVSGTASLRARPWRSLALEIAGTFPHGVIRVRARQKLPAGFSLGVDYGGVTPYQPVQGALTDPHQVRFTLTRAWDVRTPGRGGAVTGTLTDHLGNPVQGAVVQLERFRVLTDEAGAFAFRTLPQGDYVLDVDPTSLPADLAWADGRRRVRIDGAGDGVRYALKVARYGTIRGVVYRDLDGNGIYDPGEGFAAAPITLGHRTTAPDPDGRFVFHNVAPGEHTVRIMALHVADGYEPVGTTAYTRVVGVVGDTAAPATFQVARTRRSIRFDTLPDDDPTPDAPSGARP